MKTALFLDIIQQPQFWWHASTLLLFPSISHSTAAVAAAGAALERLLDAGGAGDRGVVFVEQSCCRCLCLLCPSVQLAHFCPHSAAQTCGVLLALCTCCCCGFLRLLLCVWPLQSGHNVQHLSVHVSAFVVCVAIAKWSQGAAVCLFMCQAQPTFYPLIAAPKGPLLALLSRGCFKTCPRPFSSLACGPSCCGAVCGLTLRCSRWALASSWSPLVPLSFFGVGLMDSPLSTLLHPSLACGPLQRSCLFTV